MLSRKAERRLGMGGVTGERVGKGFTKESERSQGSSEHRKENEAEEMEIPVPGQGDVVVQLRKTGGAQRHCQVSGQRFIGDCLERQSEEVRKELDLKRKKIQEEFEEGLREIALKEERDLRKFGIFRMDFERFYLGGSGLKCTEELNAEHKARQLTLEGLKLRIKSCEEKVKAFAKEDRIILGNRRDAQLNALLKEYSFLGLCEERDFFPGIVSAGKQSSFEDTKNQAYSSFEGSGKEEDFVVSQTNDLARHVPENERKDSGKQGLETEEIPVSSSIKKAGMPTITKDVIKETRTATNVCLEFTDDCEALKLESNPPVSHSRNTSLDREIKVRMVVERTLKKGNGGPTEANQISKGDNNSREELVMIRDPLKSGKEGKCMEEMSRQNDNYFGNAMHFGWSDSKFLARSRCLVRNWKDQRHFRIIVEWLNQSGLMRPWRQKTSRSEQIKEILLLGWLRNKRGKTIPVFRFWQFMAEM